MAISTTWVDFLNGGTGAAIRAALNTFNKNILADVIATESRVGIAEPKITTNISDIADLDVRVTGTESDIVTLENPIVVPFVPQTVAPSHVEGQTYYDGVSGTLKVQGPIPGSGISVGHAMHIHVVNNTGAIIEKGMAVRQAGIAAGKIQVVKAIATSFDNARVFGIAQGDIGIGADGAIITFGEIPSLNTNGVTTGVPLYLSDTVAGTYVETPPDIVTRIGGVLVADAIDGVLFVAIINNKALPTVLGGLQGSTAGNDLYPLTTVVQDINDFLTTESIVMVVDPLTGYLTLSNTGNYRMNFTASMTFTSVISTRAVTVEFYNVTDNTVEFSYVKNIPRDATEDSFSFGFPFSDLLNKQYNMRIKASTTMDVTFTDISFDIQSVNII